MDRAAQSPFFEQFSHQKSKTLTSSGPIAIIVQYPDRAGLALRGEENLDNEATCITTMGEFLHCIITGVRG